ncbi:polymorphic toxin type 30 domain-containing protein [uncultured Enterococcus sp.]|uniref:polymorphic toxin type 30 domain-containing protein n=1 Tax=uncultured Enterococcus sp. TaxID=167972 RepID=UPI00374972E6
MLIREIFVSTFKPSQTIKQGKNYFDPQTGNWVRSNVFNPNSPSYNPALVNGTHIPIQSPVHIWNSPYPYIPQPHDKKE